MEQAQVLEIARLTAGTIACLTGLTRYDDQDEFMAWLVDEGDVINYGQNALFACENAGIAWMRRKTRYRTVIAICQAGRLEQSNQDPRLVIKEQP